MEYAPYLDAEGNPMEMLTFSDLVYSTRSSSDGGADQDDTGATPDGACHTTSSSGANARSDADAEGSASSHQPEGQVGERRGEDAGASQTSPATEPPAPQAEPSPAATTTVAPLETSTPASGEGTVPPAPPA